MPLASPGDGWWMFTIRVGHAFDIRKYIIQGLPKDFSFPLVIIAIRTLMTVQGFVPVCAEPLELHGHIHGQGRLQVRIQHHDGHRVRGRILVLIKIKF